MMAVYGGKITGKWYLSRVNDMFTVNKTKIFARADTPVWGDQ